LDEKKSSRRRFLKLATALSGVGALLFASKIPQVHAYTATGHYTGNGLAIIGKEVDTSPIHGTKSLTIVTLPEHGNAKRAYTTSGIQSFLGPGVFLNGNKKDHGIRLEDPSPSYFRVTNPEFNVNGEDYFWEASDA